MGTRSAISRLCRESLCTPAKRVACCAGVREVIRLDGRLEVVPCSPAAPQPQAAAFSSAASPAPSTHPAALPSTATSAATPSSVTAALSHAQSSASSPKSAAAGTAPVVPPMPQWQLEQLVDLVASHSRVVVLTGAGCSTEAGVPDYRGPQGAYTKHNFKPMTHQQFMAGAAQRARYFARSFFGWHEFSSSRPSGAQEGLARLVQAGWVSHIITQNVDRLHHKAGTPADRVLELHGTTFEVRCLGCGCLSPRHALQQQLARMNPAAADLAAQLAQASPHSAAPSAPLHPPPPVQTGDPTAAEEPRAGQQLGSASEVMRARPSTQPAVPGPQLVPVRRPDGDVELQDAGAAFQVPGCEQCGGLLKPDVVFFGDAIPKDRTQRSLQLASEADLLLIVGSSVMVYSAYRLADATSKARGKVGIVNVGPTRADGLAHWKAEALAGETMMRLAAHPRLLLPRPV
ncbi:DHS-like NAD/FAD-binding domain-containing protein [Haematococcus lacustris]